MPRGGQPPGTGSIRTPEICAEICERLSNGETLADICRSEGMPNRNTVWDWKDQDPEFAGQFARARDQGFDVIAENALEIADTPQVGIIEKTDATGATITREDMLGHRRLQVETRLKLLAKWDPKRYGDRQVLAGDPTAPLQTRSTVSFEGLDPAARAALRSVLESVAARDSGESDKP